MISVKLDSLLKIEGTVEAKESQTFNSSRKRQSSLSLSIRFALDVVATTHLSKTKIDRRMRPVMKRNFLVSESCNSLSLETQR